MAKDSIASTSTPRAVAAAATAATGARRSSRRKASLDAQKDEPQPPVPKRATRQSKRLSGDAVVEEVQLNDATRKKSRGRPKASRISEEAVESPQQQAHPVESAKIALPMSDTPIINRNKEMRRKGNSNRRSSLGSRGRRASSLIESGQTAIPHREVDAAEFYKHIEAERLPEPRRMKQLLMWCGERALAAKPPHGTRNSNAILGGTVEPAAERVAKLTDLTARAIQDQLLKDFASRSEFSDWFSRDDTVPEPRTVVRKPNPRNTELDEKVASLEGKIKRWVARHYGRVEPRG